MAGSFIDTNVLVYLASGDPVKADRAEAVLRMGGTISVQVLNELVHVARRKMHLTWPETHEVLSTIRSLVAVQPLTTETHDIGLALAERHGFSTYDSMIAAAALQAGCDRLWSEDLQDGMVVDGRLRVVNPFPPDKTAPGIAPRGRMPS